MRFLLALTGMGLLLFTHQVYSADKTQDARSLCLKANGRVIELQHLNGNIVTIEIKCGCPEKIFSPEKGEVCDENDLIEADRIACEKSNGTAVIALVESRDKIDQTINKREVKCRCGDVYINFGPLVHCEDKTSDPVDSKAPNVRRKKTSS